MLVFGTPHLRILYECASFGGGCQSMDRCDYLGVQGWRRHIPPDGLCPLIKTFPLDLGDWRPFPARAPTAAPLYSERIGPLYWGVIAFSCPLKAVPPPACARVDQLVAARQHTVAECTYGPIDDDGTTKWRHYAFWHDRAPPDLASYAVPGEDHPFLILGTQAVAACPKDAAAARAVFEAGRLPPAAK